MVRGAGTGVPGPAAGRLGARDLPEAAQGETRGARRGGEAGRAGRQARAVRLRADGRHLRAGPRCAGAAGLCGQPANSAGAVRRLSQREDAERERAAHQPGGARRHGAVRPAPPLSLRRRRARETLSWSAWTWCAAGATGWPTPPSPLPILRPADGVEPLGLHCVGHIRAEPC